MKLIIGLGNPGSQYTNTRHNAGFIIIDQLSEAWHFPAFEFNKKFKAEISESNLAGEKIILAKPQTFMNLSGLSVRAIVDFYKIDLVDLIVIHDDLDIALGFYKISLDSSAGKHNGVQNIIEILGTQKFKRVRIGIEGPEAKKERKISGKDFVMQKFSTQELETIQKLTTKIQTQL